MTNPQTSGSYYGDNYGYDKEQINDSISLGNFLWLATGKGVIKINQTTRERTEYTKENSELPANEVESIAASQALPWIGTYGNRIAFMDDKTDKWVAVPYDMSLFEEGTIEKEGKVLLKGDEDNWLRTNYIHFDVNDTLWVGTSVGLLRLKYKAGKAVWTGLFNPTKGKPLNVLFIRDVENGIEISGNYGKRGYEKPIDEIKTYLLPSTISAETWQAMEEVPTDESISEDIDPNE